MGVKRKKSGGHDEATGSSPTVQPANDKWGVHHPHDHLVKCAFRSTAIAKGFFAAHLGDKGLSESDLENIKLSSPQHQETLTSTLDDDIIYRGQRGERAYYIMLEHQSTRDKKMPVRFLEYATALINRHFAQGGREIPDIFPICLYHDTAASRKKNHGERVEWGCPTSLYDSSFVQEVGHNPFINVEFKLVDLTTLTDTQISTHGYAAILEWILQDAALPGEEFLQKAKKHLKDSCYTSMGAEFDKFHSALGEYIAAMYDGDKSTKALIEEFKEVIAPQGRGAMGKLADTLREEGREEGRLEGAHEEELRIAQRMLDRGYTREEVEQCTDLPSAELVQLSPNREESTPPLRTSGAVPSPNFLMQGMGSFTEQGTSVAAHKTASGDHTLGTFSPVQRMKPKDPV